MSQDTDTLTETVKTNPVGAQEVSSEIVPPKVKRAKETDDGDVDFATTPEFEKAVEEAVKTQFDVKPDSWGIRTVFKFMLDFPSGQRALVKHLHQTDLVRYDLLEELDFFTKRLFPPAYDASGKPIEPEEGERTDIYATLRDPEKRLRFYELTNKLLAVAMIKPQVINDGVAIIHDDDLDQDVEVFGHEVTDIDKQIELFGKPVRPLDDSINQSYAGTIPFSDRMYLFHALNQPLEQIEPFREGPDAMLEDLE